MSEIEQVPAILTVIEDGGEYVIQASKATGKRLGALILGHLSEAHRVTYMDDLGVKVFKRNGNGSDPVRKPPAVVAPQEKETPQKRILQDASAPPAPETAEEDYEASLRQQEAEAAELARQEQFNSQDALPPSEEEAPELPKKRQRNLNVATNVCGRCLGTGEVMGDSGFTGVCPVCAGKKTIQAWGRPRR